MMRYDIQKCSSKNTTSSWLLAALSLLVLSSAFLVVDSSWSHDDNLNNSMEDEENFGADLSKSCQDDVGFNIAQEEACQDLHELCEGWAAAGECVVNPKYMRSACRRSCILCYDHTDLDSLHHPDTAKRRLIFSKMDIGEYQLMPQETEKERQAVIDILKAMDTYSKEQVTQPAMDDFRQRCTNIDKKCAIWASQNHCVTNYRFMIAACPLACQMCSDIPMFERCSSMDAETNALQQQEETNAASSKITPTSLVQKALMTANKLDYDIIFNGNNNDNSNINNDQPWVAQLNNFLTEVECDALVSSLLTKHGSSTAGPLLEWTTTTGEDDSSSYHRHTQQRAKCNESCEEHEIHQQVLAKISSLFGISESYLTFLEFLKFERCESIGAHHDYKAQHEWLPAGPPVLSLLLCLTESDNGGAVGFPDLNWTFIKLKKGHMILWPNVMDDGRKHVKMISEMLPIVSGTSIFAKIYVHAADWRKENTRGCT